MSDSKKLIWGSVGILGCLYFFKHPEVFADILTNSTRWFSESLGNIIKI